MTEDSNLAFEEPENTTPTEEATKHKPVKPGKAKKYVLEYDGKIGGLYKLYLLDFFMRIITIGIYAFWGKTRLRKYMASHFSLGGDRFEYTGKGGELFKGFLKALPILVILIFPLYMIDKNPLFGLFFIPYIYFFGIAIYGAIRYRYSRTRWRGIRGYLDGSTLGYANLVIVRMLLNVITLGFAIPSSDIAKHKYIMNNAYFGSINAEFDGNSKVLFGAYIKSMLMVFVLLILIGGFVALAVGSTIMIDTQAAGIFIVFGIVAFSLIFPLARSIYAAALMREKMRSLKVGHLKFMCTVTAGALIKHRLANLLILIFTLGLGFPVVVNRNMKFTARHHIIMGDLNAFQAQQAEDQGITSGEGLETGFDIDAGFI